MPATLASAPVSETPSDPSTGQVTGPVTGPVESDRGDAVDLDAIEATLNAVEAALGRLADGTYRSDEVTGQPIPDEVLAADPTARRS